jgi:hypothetical protein
LIRRFRLCRHAAATRGPPGPGASPGSWGRRSRCAASIGSGRCTGTAGSSIRTPRRSGPPPRRSGTAGASCRVWFPSRACGPSGGTPSAPVFVAERRIGFVSRARNR